MSGLETAACTGAGIALIAVAVRDVFDALFHPEGRAPLGRMLARAIWRVFRALHGRPRVFSLAGPLTLLATISAWALLLIAGWALVFWPHVGDGLAVSDRAAGGGLVDALHLSLETLTTLGLSEVTPTAAWLRLVVPLEALVGFGLLSASISWLLLLYPVLSRRRSLAYEINLLARAEGEAEVTLERLDPDIAERLYAELTGRLVSVERDMVSFPIAYYFVEADRRFSLPTAAPYLLELAERGQAEDLPARVRVRARLLREAVDDLAVTVAERFHGERNGRTTELLRAYARDHRIEHVS